MERMLRTHAHQRRPHRRPDHQYRH
jgi:hypothetical protein